MADTIAAIATALRPSAIGIVRVSGPDTCVAVDRAFRAASAQDAAHRRCRLASYGSMLDPEGRVIDDGLCILFPEGGSYTGELSAELYCHGSPVVLEQVLESLLAGGARQAAGGEFTKRAFLSGRLDLIQAEAVADLIDAETAEEARNAAGQLGGTISRQIQQVYDGLMEVLSRFYAAVDYPDEEIEAPERQTLAQTLENSEQTLERILSTFRRGRILKQGIPSVLLGRPNAGKSSLLNALLGYDRAIVTDVPGTTRDTVEEKLVVGKLLLRLCDTAGIRQTADVVERIGVDRARNAAAGAELALLVLDGSRPVTEEDRQAAEIAKECTRAVAVVNKNDLPQQPEAMALAETFPVRVSLSARTGEGLDELCRAIGSLYPETEPASGQLLTNPRQAEAVRRALEAVKRAKAAMENGLTDDVILTDGEEALSALGELNGKNIREDLVATIFSRFCVGK